MELKLSVSLFRFSLFCYWGYSTYKSKNGFFLSLLDYGYFPFLYDDTISLKVSKSVFFHVRNLRSESKIAFRIIPNSNNFALWGNDIIDQYNWFFDYNTMLVTISNKPIDINVQNSIKIAYENK